MHEPSVSSRELMAENETLRARMAYLLEQAERNHEIMCRHQAFDLQIVGASSFPDLVGTIFSTLPVISDLDIVTLSLIDQNADIYTVMHRLGVDFETLPNLMFCEHAVELGFDMAPERQPRPILGPYAPGQHRAMFPQPPADLRSVALVPLLRNKRLIGSLNLGSTDPGRFTPALGTDFVEHMGSIIAICLENVISNEMLKYIGLTDSLTGAYNRRYMDRRLAEEIARAAPGLPPVMHVHRHRPLQARQRYGRPPGWGRCAARGVHPHQGRIADVRYAVPLWRRGIRRGAD